MKSRLLLPLTIVLVAVCLLEIPCQGAMNVYLELKANGTDVDGETTVASIGGIDVSTGFIECLAVNHEIFGGDSGRLTHAPIKVVKRVDTASPLLYQAMGQNQIVDGKFKYFRANQETGEVEHYFTIEISQGRVSGIRHWFPNTIDAATVAYPHMEEVSVTYRSLRIINETQGSEFVFDVGSPL